MSPQSRWSDERLEVFHAEFQAHVKNEEAEQKQQNEIYKALFQLEDENRNVPPGVIQLLGQINTRMKTMEIAADRQKTFLGGFVFALTCLGFFLTESAHRLMTWLRGI